MKRKTTDQFFEIVPEYIQNIFAEVKENEGTFTEDQVRLIKDFHQVLAHKADDHKQKYLFLASNLYIAYQTEGYHAVIADLFNDLLAKINLREDLLALVATKICQQQEQIREQLLEKVAKQVLQERTSNISCCRLPGS